MGAWIETGDKRHYNLNDRKLLPLWEHGLKHKQLQDIGSVFRVAPFMGAWIETALDLRISSSCRLLPLWEHGLKHKQLQDIGSVFRVAPFMGAWIETS